MNLFFILLLSIFSFTINAKSISLTLGYPEFPPFTFSSKHGADGIGIHKFNRLTADLNLIITFVPIASYGKGVVWLKKGKIDGLLLATQNSERDKIAVFSEYIMFNRWVWFSHAEQELDFTSNEAKNRRRVITHTNANTHKWLLKSGYKIIESSTNVDSMIRLLMKNRVDAVFIAELVFVEALAKTKWTLQDLKVTEQISKPFGIYLRKSIIQKYPLLMPKLNDNIKKQRDLH